MMTGHVWLVRRNKPGHISDYGAWQDVKEHKPHQRISGDAGRRGFSFDIIEKYLNEV